MLTMTRTMLTLLVVTLTTETAVAATGAVMKIDVPSHIEWCVKSGPLLASKLSDDGFRNGAVSGLSDRILVPANNAGLSGTGIPFVASITKAPPADTASAAGATFVITACAVVKATDPPSSGGLFRRQVASASGYAALCGVGDIKACRTDITDKIATDIPATNRGTADSWQWRTTQALGSDDTVSNLVSSVTDTSLRPVKGSTPANVPEGLIVILVFPPGQEPTVTSGP